MDNPIQIFCCYAREDQAYLLQLKDHLSLLERNGLIVVQADIMINPGEDREKKISHYLNTAQIILLLVSTHFMASGYCYSKMIQAMERYERGEAQVIPIILSPVDWQKAPFDKLQVLPTNAQPITLWRNRDEVFLDITQGIGKVVEELKSKPHNGSPIPSVPIFFVNVAPPTVKEVYGREFERLMLLNHVRKGGCISIIGPRRIGKSWLVHYLCLVEPDKLGPNFRLGYIDATSPSCATREGFITTVLKALDYPSSPLSEHPNLVLLEDFVKDMAVKRQTLILCVDEFECLTQRAEFDVTFFTELRSITQVGLGMVVVSKNPLMNLVSKNLETSSFFNVFTTLRLAPFDLEDAQQFAQEKSIQAGFTNQERTYLLKYAQESNRQAWPPLRLQLVGELLLNNKRLAAGADHRHYRPDDPEYWMKFKEYVEDIYQGMVKP